MKPSTIWGRDNEGQPARARTASWLPGPRSRPTGPDISTGATGARAPTDRAGDVIGVLAESYNASGMISPGTCSAETTSGNSGAGGAAVQRPSLEGRAAGTVAGPPLLRSTTPSPGRLRLTG
jgi:hypothetical protein